MAPKILVVDSNEAFATMLKEILEAEGGYSVDVAQSERKALGLLPRTDYALTIVDMGLDPGGDAYLDLIHKVRQGWPTMRLVLIPLMGEDLPPEARRLDIQGTLTKPFFVDDLLPDIQEALAKKVRPAGAALPVEPAPAASLSPSRPVSARPLAPRPAERPAPGSGSPLADLVRETGANVALLISIAAGQEGLVSYVGAMAKSGAEELAGLIVAAIRAAQAAGRFLRQPDAPFEHSMFESGDLRLYVLALPGERLLAVVTPVSAPLGMVRQNLRRAGRDLG
ncbi:MAG: response regulator [Anaerolineae bacterium]|nr:response regulator [Anaerolineae bacterium]